MRRLILLVLVMNCTSVVVQAEEYRLRAEAFELVSTENPNDPLPKAPLELTPVDQLPKESLLHAIEVIAQPGEKFHTKVVIDKQTIVVRGKFTQRDDGTFLVQIRHSRSVETGAYVLTAAETRVSVPGVSSVSTTVAVVPGTPLAIGGGITTLAENGKAAIKREYRVLVTLTKVQEKDET